MRNQPRTYGLVITLSLCAFPPCVKAGGQPTWEIFQLTSGASLDFVPAVEGTTYVWQRKVGGSGAAIMRWSEGDPTPVQISATTSDWRPRISGGQVIWYSNPSGDAEIKLWNSGVISTLTSNADEDTFPDIGGFGKVWKVSNFYLLYDDGIQQVQLTAGIGGSATDEAPAVADDWVVWHAGSGDNEIYFWNAGTLTQLTNEPFDNRLPETDGQSIVWQGNGGIGTTPEIYRWTEAGSTTRLTNNTVYDVQPDISGDVVVFSRDVGGDFEIFLRYLGADYQITDNNYNDFEPAIDGNRIVWEGKDGGGSHIFYAIINLGGDPVGACCTGMICALDTQANCLAAGAYYVGDETFCTADTCPDAVAPAPGWSTLQHDHQRTGRTTAVVPSSPSVIWTLFADPALAISPTLAPDGSLLVAAGEDLLSAVNADGTLKWQVDLAGEGPAAAASIRADGRAWVPLLNGVTKFEGTDGGGLCGWPDAGRATVALAADGTVFSANAYARTAACEQQWTYSPTHPVNSHVALGHDGYVYMSFHFNLVKLDRDSGTELWNYETPGVIGAPAIAADGTIYVHYAPNTLLAVNPDGTEQWSLPLTDLSEVQPAGSPAIAADGSIYMVSKLAVGENTTVVAVSPGGAEIWRHVESVSTGVEDLSPIIDGEGTVIVAVAFGDIVALSPTDGSELWRVSLSGGDSVNSQPAIGEDGTIYVTTENGYLMAFGEGCESPSPQTPPFTFRAVVTESTQVEGLHITTFEDFDLLPDGRVVFMSDVGQSYGRSAFTELPGGGWDVLHEGTVVGGRTIASMGLPRYDYHGNRYLPAVFTFGGWQVARNDEIVLRDGSPEVLEVAAIDIYDMSGQFFDIDEVGRFEVFGRISPNTPLSVLRINPVNLNVEELMSIGNAIGDFQIDGIDLGSLDERHVDNNTRTFVIRDGNVQAVTNDLSIRVRTNDVIDGRTLTGFASPQVDGGEPVYLAQFAGGNGIFTINDSVVTTGSQISGHTITSILNHSYSNGVSAFMADLAGGATGVFRGSAVVAVEGSTVIEGKVVQTIDSRFARQNSSNDVAFVAALTGEQAAVFVASGPDGTMTYRRVVAVGNMIDGANLTTIDDLRLDDSGLVAFASGSTPATRRLLLETEIGVFETINQGDQIAGLTVDFALGHAFAPRFNAAGTEFLCMPVDPVGPVVFVDRVPIVQPYWENPEGPPYITDAAEPRFVNPNNVGSFVVADAALQGVRIMSLDTNTGTLSPVIERGDSVDGFLVDGIESVLVDQYGDDGLVVFRASDLSTGDIGILTQNDVLVRTGDMVDGVSIVAPDDVRRSPGGIIYFRDGDEIFRRLPNGNMIRVRGAGDIVAGHPILGIDAFDGDGNGRVAYRAQVLGGTGLFVDDLVLALPELTVINGEQVNFVGTPIRMNAAGQIAFVASTDQRGTTIFVGTLDLSFDFDGDGEVGTDDLLAFEGCYGGQENECACLSAFDGNGNRAMDCDDWKILAAAWTEPESSPAFEPCEQSYSTPLALLPEPQVVARNRFVAMLPPVSDEPLNALRVDLFSLHHPAGPANAPNFSAFEGQYRYVNAIKDGQGNPVFDCPDSAGSGTSFKCAVLGCAPEYRDWAAIASGEVLHVTGSAVVPSSTYHLVQVPASCIGQETSCAQASNPLTVSTERWGNVDNDPPGGAPNAIDISRVVDKAKDLPSAFTEHRCQLREAVPNPYAFAVNALDIGRSVDAAKGQPYPFTIAVCP